MGKNIITKTLKPLLAKLEKSRALRTEEAVKNDCTGLEAQPFLILQKEWSVGGSPPFCFLGIRACADTLLSSDPTILSPSVYLTCDQSLGLVPSPEHTKG